MFSNTSSGNYLGANANANNNTEVTPRAIIPDSGVTQISGARPNQKRQPHGGAKSHKLLDKASFQNLFVARLPRALTDNDAFLEVFSHYNPVSATIMMNVETGQSKGFGFVTFETEAEGRLAFDNLNNRKLRVKTTTSTGVEDSSSFVFFTPEIKPSTFNGHRIIVESPHVYIRNIPAQLLMSTTGGGASFENLINFFSSFGEVLLIEFHGGQSISEIVMQNTAAPTAPPVLVSFATKEQAAAAIAACHGKVLFPEYSTTIALMAKYADMTTVKSINRHTTTSTTIAGGLQQQQRKGSGSNSSFGGSTTTAGGGVETQSTSTTNAFPFPVGPNPSSSSSSATASIVPGVQRNYSDGSLPSPANSTRVVSAGGQQQQQRRPSPPTEFWAPLLQMPPLQQPGMSVGAMLQQPQQQHSSSNNSSVTDSSRRGSNSLAGSSYHSSSTHQQAARVTSTAPPLYRNDPYNQSGYVMVTSSSSSASSRRSSSFILGSDQEEE